MVELGAGCGVVGVAAARAGAEHVLLTDLASITPALKVSCCACAGLRLHLKVAGRPRGESTSKRRDIHGLIPSSHPVSRLQVNVQANAAGFAAGAACVTVHSLDWSSVPPPCCFHSGAAETEAPLHPWLQWAATNGWNAVDLQHLLHAEVRHAHCVECCFAVLP